jgi:hypothetical protein
LSSKSERERERETEFSRRDFVGIMSFNDAFYYICKELM